VSDDETVLEVALPAKKKAAVANSSNLGMSKIKYMYKFYI
jgi:hypothetical protein